MIAETARWVIMFGSLMGNPAYQIDSEGVYTSRAACERRARALDAAVRFDSWYHFCRRVDQ